MRFEADAGAVLTRNFCTDMGKQNFNKHTMCIFKCGIELNTAPTARITTGNPFKESNCGVTRTRTMPVVGGWRDKLPVLVWRGLLKVIIYPCVGGCDKDERYSDGEGSGGNTWKLKGSTQETSFDQGGEIMKLCI